MKICKEDRCCTFCRYWDVNAICNKKGCVYEGQMVHGLDHCCDNWKKAFEFMEHRPKKPKIKIEKVSLFDK